MTIVKKMLGKAVGPWIRRPHFLKELSVSLYILIMALIGVGSVTAVSMVFLGVTYVMVALAVAGFFLGAIGALALRQVVSVRKLPEEYWILGRGDLLRDLGQPDGFDDDKTPKNP